MKKYYSENKSWGEGMISQDLKRSKAKDMVNSLMEDEELLNEFNYLMRKEKLKKIQEK
jgi:hypothetical protein